MAIDPSADAAELAERIEFLLELSKRPLSIWEICELINEADDFVMNALSDLEDGRHVRSFRVHLGGGNNTRLYFSTRRIVQPTIFPLDHL